VKKLLLAIVWLASLLVVGELTARYAMKGQLLALGFELDKMQSMLAFNHMQTYRELETDLANGCYEEALLKAKISKERELSLIKSFNDRQPDPSFSKYISDREPALLDQLKSFKSTYEERWPWPKCNK
jgi:hypothetical protein